MQIIVLYLQIFDTQNYVLLKTSALDLFLKCSTNFPNFNLSILITFIVIEKKESSTSWLKNAFWFLSIKTCNKLEFKEQQQDCEVALTKQKLSCLQDLSLSTDKLSMNGVINKICQGKNTCMEAL